MISYEEGEWRGRERGTVESSLAGRQAFLHKNFFVVGQRREASRSQSKNRSNGNWQGSHNGRSRQEGEIYPQLWPYKKQHNYVFPFMHIAKNLN